MTDGALAWIGQVVEWFGRFIPRWIILNTTEGAVAFVRGAHPVELGPGVHWYWPAWTEIKAWVVARQSINLTTQTITTKDDKVLAVGAVIVFRVTDALTLITKTFDPDVTIRAVAAGAIHAACSGVEWAELKMAKDDGSLDTMLRRELQRRLGRRFGIKVLDATLTDFAPCRVLKVIQTTASDTES
jgi:regulator of protease activity HflC (stomatin/prohibitin superfamily)